MNSNANSGNHSQSDELRLLRERNLVEQVNGVPVRCDQYGTVLLDFKKSGAVPDSVKRIWKTLYFASGQLLTEDIAEEIGAGGIGTVNMLFGGFASRFYSAFKETFAHHPRIKEGPKKEDGCDTVYTEMFLDLETKKDRLIYCSLRKGFAAALEAVYGDEILNW